MAGVLVKLCEEGHDLEWHREGHLKRTTLALITQAVLDAQSDGATNKSLEGSLSERASTRDVIRISCGMQEEVALNERTSIRLFLLKEYETCAPLLYRGLVKFLTELGATVEHTPTAGATTVVVLCPELFDNATLATALITHLQAGLAPASATSDSISSRYESKALKHAVRLYSTAVPFDYYIQQCPVELKSIGLLGAMYEKWPSSDALRRAAAAHSLASFTGASKGQAHWLRSALQRGMSRLWLRASVVPANGVSGKTVATHESNADESFARARWRRGLAVIQATSRLRAGSPATRLTMPRDNSYRERMARARSSMLLKRGSSLASSDEASSVSAFAPQDVPAGGGVASSAAQPVSKRVSGGLASVTSMRLREENV